ncbi:hypothetical protein ASC59_15830 [Leifsonia sp. Root1293]|nr:hypothetical protein ASC59_15830 [Leifsonia sp. Root1293]KRA09506.1 hypothetical protein ASD61_15825 [Leifsonia sp. Root60]
MRRRSVLDRMTDAAGPSGTAAYVGVLSIAVLAACGAIGLALRSPWLFPSLGPTVMLIFGSAGSPSSRPLNAAVGHAVGIGAGVLCLLVFGLNGQPSAPDQGLTPAYLAAAALSVGITAFVLSALRLPHPPAGATTMIISLGVIADPTGILSMAGALAFTIIASWGVNMLLGTRPAGNGR